MREEPRAPAAALLGAAVPCESGLSYNAAPSRACGLPVGTLGCSVPESAHLIMETAGARPLCLLYRNFIFRHKEQNGHSRELRGRSP
jgi:hypothetical protein